MITKLHLEPALPEDIPALLCLCRAAALSPGSTWNNDYPNEEILAEDIRYGALFKIIGDDVCIGLFSLGMTGELDMLSDAGDGARPFDFARFGIHPAYQGMGLGNKALSLATAYCHEKNCTAIRLLVRPGNPSAVAVYKKAGFEKIRQVFLWNHDYWYCRKQLTVPSCTEKEAL